MALGALLRAMHDYTGSPCTVVAHAVKDANGRAYNRTAHLPARRAMMQTWANYLDQLRTGGTVIPLHKAA